MRTVPIADLLVLQRAGYWGEDAGTSEIDVPVIRNGDVLDSGDIQWKHLPTRGFREDDAEKARVMSGDVVLTVSGNCGYAAYVATEPITTTCASNFVRVLRFDATQASSHYVFHFMHRAQFRASLAPFIRGTTMKNLAVANALAQVRIPLPSIREQCRIVEVLDEAEALRAERRASLVQLDLLTQSIFLDMFGGPTAVLSRWPVRQLGQLLDFMTSGSRGWAEYYAESGDLFIRIQNVQRDELVLDDITHVDAPHSAEAERTRVQAGDVLLSITADLGRTAVVPEGLGAAFINQHLSILRTRALVPRFLSAYLTSPAGQRQVLGRNRQGVKAGLNFDDIRALTVPIPPHELQCEFARRVAAVEKLKTTHRASMDELDTLFASLQNRAFRGEL
ncbi:hypothetical protein SMC3_01335 [Candidatus Cryosericum hinesii]|uniref:Type I restriction modification DNA specificity domain-containing protein n=1 Tax=Candidatus Cryosericum hinesii TaxID=2290915 RepID=A0A398DU01_9BACT|nr:restriction endonuclease subunit S [Candidatus Cryosericum hinesii]RIE09639.1 hypothetical protein SMC4_04395 [Candidatus Cryosericum hinesii]RIE14294.1 hypothetical protein SMC2_02825 [Candidatus Cryosericum hinesii]RIE14744.1 hypothetical protein SMC3_01335 [Candidatus Cryosericum hinesii]